MADNDRWNDRPDHLTPYGRPDDVYGEFGPGAGPRAREFRTEGYRRNEYQRRPEGRRGQEHHDQRYAPFGAAGPVASSQGTYDDRGEPYGSGWDQVNADTGGRRGALGDDQRDAYGYERYGRPHDYPHRSGDVRGGDHRNREDRFEDRAREAGREARSWWDRATEKVSNLFEGDEGGRDRYAGTYGGGEYRGRGPKNYRRSDDRIREDVSDRLTDDPYLDASDIEVAVTNSEVTLSGTIRRREDKRRAENLAEAISGVTHVQNNLRVAQDGAQRDRTDLGGAAI